MRRPPRVGVLGLWHESNSFVGRRTELDDFDTYEGEQVRARWEGSHSELGGFFAGLDESGLSAVPLFTAAATPGGEISSEACDALLNRSLTAIQSAGTLDGLLVAAHGAAVCAEHPDADGWWMGQLREAMGSTPVVATIDSHANVSVGMARSVDALVAYRTNPHLDTLDRGVEAARLISKAVLGTVTLTQVAAFPPLAINVLLQETSVDPCLSIGAAMDEVRRDDRVLSASFCLGYRFADVPDNAAAVIVVTDGEVDAAREQALSVSRDLVDRRIEFVAQSVSVEAAIDIASRTAVRVLLLDTGDNIGGGSAGDGTVLARAMSTSTIERSFVAIFDPTSVDLAEKVGVGGEASFEIGGKTDDLHGAPLVMQATVASLHAGSFFEDSVRHAGIQVFDMGPTAILVTSSGMTIQLTSKRVMPFSIGQLTSCGLHPENFDVIVAKGTNAPVPAYAPYCPTIIRVGTPGSTRADMQNLPYTRRRTPLYPFESELGRFERVIDQRGGLMPPIWTIAKSLRTTRAALRPFAPITDPPGCVPAPHR